MPSSTCSSAIAAGADWFGKLLPATQYQIGFVTAIDGRVDRIVDNLAVAHYRAIGPLELAGAPGVGIGLAYIPLGGAAATGLILLLTGAGYPRSRRPLCSKDHLCHLIAAGDMAAGLDRYCVTSCRCNGCRCLPSTPAWQTADASRVAARRRRLADGAGGDVW